jgi:hypothetical protein
VDAVTVLVLTAKVKLVAPAGMVTLAGTLATAVLLLERVTRAPPVGAGPLSAKVPLEGDPPITLFGLSVSEVRVGPEAGGGVTVRDAVRVTPAWEAEIVTDVELATAIVVTWNVPIAVPAGMVTLAGTVAADVLLLERETTVPPAGAGPLRVTVPVDGLPPFTLVGLSASEDRTGELGGGTLVVPVPPPQEFEQKSETASSPRAAEAARPGR